MSADQLARALEGLLRRDQINTCQHEQTHRGGAIWEVCDDCGRKWADDEGGKPAWQDPKEWVSAEQALAAHRAQAASPHQVAQWQPIETAPKDGRDLLLWDRDSYVPFVGAWRNGCRPGWHCDTEHYNTDGDACVTSNLWQGGITHWMPLPAVPTKEPTNG